MKKIILVNFFLIMILLVGCLKGTNTNQEENMESIPNESNKIAIADDYKIQEETYVYDEEKKSYKVNYIQISGIKDKNLEENINRAIKLSVTEWLNEETDWMEDCTYTVTCNNQNYLSMYYETKMETSRKYTITRFGVTVDMNTGKRVFLNELFENNSHLKERLKNCEYADLETPPVNVEGIDEIIYATSISEMDYFIEEFHKNKNMNLGSFLFFKASFYLTDKKIVVVRNLYDNRGEFDDIFIDFKVNKNM